MGKKLNARIARNALYGVTFTTAAVGSAGGLATLAGVNGWLSLAMIAPALGAEVAGFVLVLGARERVVKSERPWFQMTLANLVAAAAIALQIFGHLKQPALAGIFVFFSLLSWIIVLVDFAEHSRDWAVAHEREVLIARLHDMTGQTEEAQLRAQIAEQERLTESARRAEKIAYDRLSVQLGADHAELMRGLIDFPDLTAQARVKATAEVSRLAAWLASEATPATPAREVETAIEVEVRQEAEIEETETVTETVTETREVTRSTARRSSLSLEQRATIRSMAAGGARPMDVMRALELTGNPNKITRTPEWREGLAERA